MNMKRPIRMTVFLLVAVLGILTVAEAKTMEPKNEQKITVTQRASLAASPGPSDYFTGAVEVVMLIVPQEPARTSGAHVTFAPGARTAWHSHPYGQTLIVTDGSGRVQQWDGTVEEMNEGDVISIPPGVKHWHGAAPNSSMTHIAVQESLNGSAATWMEQVSDEQYR